MIETVFRSEDVPPAERFAYWQEMATRAHTPTMIRSDHEADFRATVRNLHLGAVQVSALTYPPIQVSRTPKLIRQFDPERFQLWLNLKGTIVINQGGRSAELGPQDLVLFDTWRPYNGRTDAVAGIVLEFPRVLMPINPDALRELAVVRLPAGEGLGALLSRHLTGLAAEAAHYRPADTARLSGITLDLLAALYAHHLEADTLLPLETRQQALCAQIHDFIQQRLGDPDLTPECIAAAHRISTRSLYKIFQGQGLTVAAWIRQRRLERCRHDLTRPELSRVPIHAIAARWGFTNNAHFSRVFRTAYGISPRDYQHLTRSDAVREPA
ncbi:helix-turn-helix domain-containing protein [Actinoallomurus bryophytorum]|uniref:Helix-turn-helix protein n=2 Tax=Actinoallomurus bryophytorum TaxID=1490222 RepID=A0A543C028_9ACTN|nr:helix-turn-helix protein [Actinoallomurus bryophytorum]